MHQDSKGRFIKIGDQVTFRGRPYTIERFFGGGPWGVKFVEEQHVSEVAVESTVDLIPAVE
jgi:hypothetical protein